MTTLDVFIVDDNEVVRMALAGILNGAGYTTEEASNAKDALVRLMQKDAQPRVIISDYNMPGMKGPEFTQAIRKFSTLRNVPILMISAEIGEDKVTEAKAAGITAWIKKSAVGRELLPTIRKYIP